MKILFNITVVFLQILARIFGTNYVTVNIWFYCIVGPLFYLALMLILWVETSWSVLQNNTSIGAVNTILIAILLVAVFVSFCHIVASAIPVFHSLTVGDKRLLFQNCVDYLNATRGGVSYVNINVWYFCLLGPMIFLMLMFLDITGAHQFHWHWLAVFHEPYVWRYWVNVAVLIGSAFSSYYALNVLKSYVLIK